MISTESVYCEATLNYSRGDGEHEPVEVTIHDGRAALDDLEFESCGFTLLQHTSEVNDWRDEAHLEEVHGPEVDALARHLTGCDHTIVFTPIIRSPQTAREIEDYAPIELVHSDFTDDYRPMLQEAGRPYRAFLDPLLEQIGLTREDITRAKRVTLMQFWRNIGAERPDYPLAFCDADTVPRSQLYTFTVPEYGGRRLEFQTFGVKPPADPDDNHWYTFPGLTASEVVAFRTYDSQCAEEGRPFWTPHSAFRDPVAGDPAPQRESLEMRVLCLSGL